MKAKQYSTISKPTLVVLFLLSFILGLTSVNAQCPTVTNNNQSFCDLESILVSDLVALDNGNGIVWYESATSTVPLSNLSSLIDGEDYYADDNSGTCGTRARVDVTIYSAPMGQNFQGVCLDDPSLATIADLVAVGNDVQWYLTASGGSPLDISTVLIDDTIYYADQANPDTGCRTSRLSVLVNVGFTPIPTGEMVQEFCFSSQFTPTVADLVASGTNNWYISLFSAAPLNESTPLVNGQTYYATTVDLPCESTGRFAVLAVLTGGPDPGTSGILDLCDTDTNTVDLFTILGGSPESGGVWSPTLNSGTGVYDPTIDPEGTYTYTVSSVNTCPDASSTVTVTIFPEPNAGTDGTLDICSDNGSVDLFTILGNTPEIGGTWSPALNSGTGIFDPLVDTDGVYTYTVNGLAPCNDATATVTVSVTPILNAGENGILEICDNNSTIDLFTVLGGTPDTGGTWSPTLNSGTGIFDPLVDTDGVYTYSFSGNAPCLDSSATVTVTVNELSDAGTNATLELCSNDSSIIDLFDSLGGTPDTGGTWSPTLASGTGIFNPTLDSQGTYTYTITGMTPCPDVSSSVNVIIIPEPNAGIDATLEICDNNGTIDLFNNLGGIPDIGGTWSPTLNSGTGLFDPTIDPEGLYTYTVSGTNPCPDASATVTVTVTPFISAGLNGTLDLCSNDSSVNLFDSLNGAPGNGGTWSPNLTSGTSVFDPTLDPEGTYTYTISGSGSCSDDSATVVVTIETAPDTGTDGVLELCDTTNTVDLFNSLGGTPDIGGSWSPTLASGTGIFDSNTDSEGIYTYTIPSTCGDGSSTVTVSIADPIDPGSNGSLELCITDTTVDLFDSLQGTPELGGTWSPTLNSGTGIFDPSVDSEGTYTYTIESNISSCPDASANVIVTIFEEPNSGTDSTLNLCGATNTVDLFNSLGGIPDTGGTWSPTLTSGAGIFDPNVDLEGAYTYTVTNPCGSSSAIVTVSFTDLNNAGNDGTLDICNNDSPEDLFNSLGGTPQAGGFWSPTLNSGTGVFDPTIDTPGTYIYTIFSGEGSLCPDDSASVTVTFIPTPNAGNDGNLDLCIDDINAVDLFDSLGGTPVTGGTWSPALTSGTGIFDPTIDTPGIYTYTVTSTECNISDDSTVTVTIGNIPDVSGMTLSIDNIICFANDVVVNIDGANQLADGNYTIVYELSGANISSNNTTISVSSGSSSFTIPQNLFPNTGLSVLTLSEFYFAGGFCSADTSVIDAIEIVIPNIPTPQISGDGTDFCEFDDPTVANLTENIISSGAIIWYNLPNGGIEYSETDALQDGVTYYAAIQSESGCESTIRLAVMVNFIDCVLELIIPDGFSPNGDTINDDFHIANLNELYPNFKLSIYNRYGNILYEGDIASNRWDGTSKKNNKTLPVGVYFYILEFNDGTRSPLQGRVYLSR